MMVRVRRGMGALELEPVPPPQHEELPAPAHEDPFSQKKIIEGIASGFLWGIGMACASRLVEALTGRKP